MLELRWPTFFQASLNKLRQAKLGLNSYFNYPKFWIPYLCTIHMSCMSENIPVNMCTQQRLKLVWAQGYKTFFMLKWVEHEICPANKSLITDNCKHFLPDIAEHENFSAYKYENANYCWHFHIYQQRKVHAQLRWAWKRFYNLEPEHLHSLNRIFTGIAKDVVSSWGQQRLWSNCPDAQADLCLHWAHVSEGTYSHFVAYIVKFEYHNYPLGPVVQSIVSLTSSLVVKMLPVLVSTISNIQVSLLKKCE